MKFVTPYNYDPSVDSGLQCTEEERMTKSEFADDCDINRIFARYTKTGILPDAARAAAARFGDFSIRPTYAEMHDKLIAAEEMFLALPAEVRREFDNDPLQFVASADTPEGRKRLIDLGLGAEQVGGNPTPSATAP